MRRTVIAALLSLLALSGTAKSRILSPQVKTLQVVVNHDWLSPAVMRLGSDDVLHVSFDELSHSYHRYRYQIEHCEADWAPSSELFESDWLEGFSENYIDNYENSINTTYAYTHYQFQIPNEHCQLKMSGNYRIHVFDEDDDMQEVLVAEFMVTEQSMSLELNLSSNTDIDANASHQQLSMKLNYGQTAVVDPNEQIKTVVRQNNREDNQKTDLKPSYQHHNTLEWTHHRQLIFDAGNEYHKFEVLDVSHPTMGLDRIVWDGEHYQAYPFVSEPRLNYLYDEDADGAFYIRNSDNIENDVASDYVWVNYLLKAPRLSEGHVMIDGQWTTDDNPYNYIMAYDEDSQLYYAHILQKQGYYSYQYLWLKADGTIQLLPSEGSFYPTENRYQVYVYFRGTGERTWRLTCYGTLQASTDTYGRMRP